MLGAMIGDIVGSQFEWNNHKSKDFELFTNTCKFTDDSVMTVAIAQALVSSNSDWNKAAKQGNGDAMCWIGNAYIQGLGVEKNEELGKVWKDEALQYGHSHGNCE